MYIHQACFSFRLISRFCRDLSNVNTSQLPNVPRCGSGLETMWLGSPMTSNVMNYGFTIELILFNQSF